MMERNVADIVKEILVRLVKEHGDSLYADVNRLSGMLHDACPSYRKEVTVLIAAAQNGLIAGIKSGGVSEVYLHSLANRLYNATGTDKVLAEWAIKTWTESLGLDTPAATLYCSFCEKSQHEVRDLIAGPGVFICDECIEVCTEGIADKSRKKHAQVVNHNNVGEWPDIDMRPKSTYCTFCGKSEREVRKLIAGPKVFICNECVELCTEIIGESRLRLVYESDFYSYSDRWLEGTLEGGCGRAFRKEGYYHIAIDHSPRWHWCGIDLPVTDFMVRVDAEFVTSSIETPRCGVIFRANYRSFYRFLISRSGYYDLDLKINDTWEHILTNRFSECIRRGNDRVNSLMIEMVGATITMEVNGHALATVRDNTLAAGNAGIIVAQYSSDSFAEARFREFQLYVNG